VVSTSGMLKAAGDSSSRQFIVGTESDLIYRLKKENPQKEFYSLGNARTCFNMKKTTLSELYSALVNEQYEVTLDKEIIQKARKSLEEMIKYV